MRLVGIQRVCFTGWTLSRSYCASSALDTRPHVRLWLHLNNATTGQASFSSSDAQIGARGLTLRIEGLDARLENFKTEKGRLSLISLKAHFSISRCTRRRKPNLMIWRRNFRLKSDNSINTAINTASSRQSTIEQSPLEHHKQVYHWIISLMVELKIRRFSGCFSSFTVFLQSFRETFNSLNDKRIDQSRVLKRFVKVSEQNCSSRY